MELPPLVSLRRLGGPRAAADDLPLREVEVLRHVADALARDGARVRDLFAPKLRLLRAPDPSELFAARRAEHLALPALREPSPLRVLSYNVGLLSRQIAIDRFEVPELAHRREVLPDRLLADRWDALLLQEVWDAEDVERFARAARRHGYAWFAGRMRRRAHGLMILVRRALVDRDQPLAFDEQRFARQRRFERIPGVGIERGVIMFAFGHRPTGLRIVLVDTHTTAFPRLFAVRAAQARQLGRQIHHQIRHQIRQCSAALEQEPVVVLGGDLNAGPYYRDDVYGEANGRPVRDWWKNALSYPLLLHYGELHDARVAAAPARDVELAHRLPPWDASYRRAPFGGSGFDPDPDRDTFTVGDHNGLYFRQYGGTEVPARIDAVMFRDPLRRVRVGEHRLAYVEPHDFGPAGCFELSDHFGVGVRLDLEAAPERLRKLVSSADGT